jgi:3-oxoacyl-[acyl-carrier protein] reductase
MDAVIDFDTVDILINNAGITKDNLFGAHKREDFDKVIEVSQVCF